MSSITGLISGGGGAGTSINGVSKFSKDLSINQFTDESGSVWLRSNNYITSGFSNYPDAEVKSGLGFLNKFGNKSFYAGTYYIYTQGRFNSNGTKLWFQTNDNSVREINLSTAYDVDTATLGAISQRNSSTADRFFWAADGSRIFSFDYTYAYEFLTSVPFSVANLSTAYNDRMGNPFGQVPAVTFGATNGYDFYAINPNQSVVLRKRFVTQNSTISNYTNHESFDFRTLAKPEEFDLFGLGADSLVINDSGTEGIVSFRGKNNYANRGVILRFALNDPFTFNSVSLIDRRDFGRYGDIDSLDNGLFEGNVCWSRDLSKLIIAREDVSLVDYTFQMGSWETSSSIGFASEDNNEFLRIK